MPPPTSTSGGSLRATARPRSGGRPSNRWRPICVSTPTARWRRRRVACWPRCAERKRKDAGHPRPPPWAARESPRQRPGPRAERPRRRMRASEVVLLLEVHPHVVVAEAVLLVEELLFLEQFGVLVEDRRLLAGTGFGDGGGLLLGCLARIGAAPGTGGVGLVQIVELRSALPAGVSSAKVGRSTHPRILTVP